MFSYTSYSAVSADRLFYKFVACSKNCTRHKRALWRARWNSWLFKLVVH